MNRLAQHDVLRKVCHSIQSYMIDAIGHVVLGLESKWCMMKRIAQQRIEVMLQGRRLIANC